jgi:vacuolar protein sorting-associated protein 35
MPLQEDNWKSKVENILKFTRQLTSILSTQVEAPTIALRLFLLAAQIADECGFEDLTYDLYVQAFTVYEDNISESRAQLQAITLVIGTLQGARVFGVDNYDTLITKAALHGAKLLKKPHQATAVHLASHLWWQEAPVVEESEEGGGSGGVKDADKLGTKEDGEGAKAVRIPPFSPEVGAQFCPQSIHIRTANAYSNVYRNLYGSPTQPPRK